MAREGLRRGTLRPRTPLSFSGRSLRSPLLSKNVTHLASFYLHFSQLSLDGPTTLTKGKEKVSDKNRTFLKTKTKCPREYSSKKQIVYFHLHWFRLGSLLWTKPTSVQDAASNTHHWLKHTQHEKHELGCKVACRCAITVNRLKQRKYCILYDICQLDPY